MKRLDLVGKRFNRLTVLKYTGSDGRNSIFLCRCTCGKKIRASGYRIKNGHCKSCGCLQKEIASINGRRQGTHFMSKSPEYSVWRGMIRRCADKSNENYGGRGIFVHPSWLKSFQKFFDHVGKRPSKKHTLDRKNTDKGYVPGNVKWSTMLEQNRNRRKFCVLSKFTDKELLEEVRRRSLV